MAKAGVPPYIEEELDILFKDGVCLWCGKADGIDHNPCLQEYRQWRDVGLFDCG